MRAARQILTVAQMRSAEEALIEGGESVSSLMERAGEGAAEWIFRMASGRPVTVLCGPGNNGGDGYVIARVLAKRGVPVSVLAPLAPRTEAAIAARRAWGGELVEHATGHVLVDCLFGSGLARPLSGELAARLTELANAHAALVAVDLPSGVDSDTGRLLNDGLPAYDLTLALGAWKFAHWLMPALPSMGEHRLVDIGISSVAGAAHLLERPHLSTPAPDAHKYSRGLLVVIGGEMPGAAMLASRAALHAGAGYVKLLAAREPADAPDELVVEDAPLESALADGRIKAILIGPGLGRSEEAKASLSISLRRDLPTVCDGDALVLLRPDMLSQRKAPLVLTPHAGELAHLYAAFSIGEAPRLERVRELARTSGTVVVAKGPDTLLAAPRTPLCIAPPASSWLSTAGTGDVLAGILASRLAAGLQPIDAAGQAVWLHGAAASRSGPAFSPAGLIRSLPDAFAACL